MEKDMGDYVIKDKEEENDVFFRCPYCRSTETEIYPEDVYLSDMSEDKGLDSIEISGECMDCQKSFTVNVKVKITDYTYYDEYGDKVNVEKTL